MGEHTPTPWRVEVPGDRIVADDHKGTMPIADIRGWGHLTGKGLGALGLPNAEGIAIQEANAAFIVKAVNAHEPMVAELQRLFELYGHQATADVLASVGGSSE